MYDLLDVRLQNKLELLATTLVPETFRFDAPQFYEMIKSFLVNIEQVQRSINKSFLDMIDPAQISSNEIMSIYFDTYLATLNLESDKDFLSGKDLLKVSKDLSVRKGTPEIYGILINLLAFMFPSITNEYYDLLALLENPNLTPEERAAIEQDVTRLRENGLTSSYVELIEDPNQVFKYTLNAEIKLDLFERYVKPFCHPAGWHIDFFQVFRRYIIEYIESFENFTISQTFKLPDLEANDPNIIANPYLNDVPITDYIPNYPIIHSDLLAEVIGLVSDPSRLYVDINDSMVYYDFQQITVPQFLANREVVDYSDTEYEKHMIRWVDASWEFPSDLFTVNMIYLANNQGIIANGGMVSNYNGKLISYKQVNEKELNN